MKRKIAFILKGSQDDEIPLKQIQQLADNIEVALLEPTFFQIDLKIIIKILKECDIISPAGCLNILSNIQRTRGNDVVQVLPFIKCGKIGSAAQTVLSCLTCIPLLNEANKAFEEINECDDSELNEANNIINEQNIIIENLKTEIACIQTPKRKQMECQSTGNETPKISSEVERFYAEISPIGSPSSPKAHIATQILSPRNHPDKESTLENLIRKSPFDPIEMVNFFKDKRPRLPSNERETKHAVFRAAQIGDIKTVNKLLNKSLACVEAIPYTSVRISMEKASESLNFTDALYVLYKSVKKWWESKGWKYGKEEDLKRAILYGDIDTIKEMKESATIEDILLSIGINDIEIFRIIFDDKKLNGSDLEILLARSIVLGFEEITRLILEQAQLTVGCVNLVASDMLRIHRWSVLKPELIFDAFMCNYSISPSDYTPKGNPVWFEAVRHSQMLELMVKRGANLRQRTLDNESIRDFMRLNKIKGMKSVREIRSREKESSLMSLSYSGILSPF